MSRSHSMRILMKYNKYYYLSLITLCSSIFGLLPIANVAAADLLPPQVAINDVSTQLKSQLQSNVSSQDFAQITAMVETIIYPHVDFDRISALVLGKHWRKADKDQRKRFKKEFKTMLVRTYARAFLEFNEWSVHFMPMTLEDGAKKAIVKTEVLQPGLQPIHVDYRMINKKGEWKVYDIMIAGISLVTNYRTSFRNEMKRRGSLDAVIANLEQRNADALSNKEENS
jgi:phospholipid transport system substrate-binding protein